MLQPLWSIVYIGEGVLRTQIVMPLLLITMLDYCSPFATLGLGVCGGCSDGKDSWRKPLQSMSPGMYGFSDVSLCLQSASIFRKTMDRHRV